MATEASSARTRYASITMKCPSFLLSRVHPQPAFVKALRDELELSRLTVSRTRLIAAPAHAAGHRVQRAPRSAHAPVVARQTHVALRAPASHSRSTDGFPRRVALSWLAARAALRALTLRRRLQRCTIQCTAARTLRSSCCIAASAATRSP